MYIDPEVIYSCVEAVFVPSQSNKHHTLSLMMMMILRYRLYQSNSIPVNPA